METKRITRDRLTELMDYNRETGELIWKCNRGRVRKGDVAGSLDSWGYLQVRIDGKSYQVHILIWLLESGEWPSREIDHWNTVKTNNRFGNLRLATRRQNASNCEVRSHSKSGVKGVYQLPNGKFMASITVNRKSRNLGTFHEKIDAALAYAHAACKHFGDFVAPSTRELARSDSLLMSIESYGASL